MVAWLSRRGCGSAVALFGVARRVIANQRRGDVRRDRLADRLRDEIRTAVDPWEPDGVGGQVAEAMARLSDDDREILALHAWEGLAPGEMAGSKSWAILKEMAQRGDWPEVLWEYADVATGSAPPPKGMTQTQFVAGSSTGLGCG